jgi:single-stranded-DNA-specific exonuclease
MKKNWVVKPECDQRIVENLSKELNINSVLTSLLVQRDITTFEEAKIFFRPELKMLHDPFLMKVMDKAIDRIDAAILNKEKVLIYGDYDVDGTSSVALMVQMLHSMSDPKHTDFYIPHRQREGYGVSKAGIDFAKRTDSH